MVGPPTAAPLAAARAGDWTPDWSTVAERLSGGPATGRSTTGADPVAPRGRSSTVAMSRPRTAQPPVGGSEPGLPGGRAGGPPLDNSTIFAVGGNSLGLTNPSSL